MTDMGAMLAQAQESARPYITRMLRNYPDDVDDVMQTAAMKALRGIGDFRGAAQFKSWFTRIAINEVLQLLRNVRTHEGRLKRVDIDELNEDGDRILELPAESPSPEQIAIANELRRAIDNEAATWGQVLKDELRLMLLGVGTGVDNTRKARRHRVRARLREALTERGLL